MVVFTLVAVLSVLLVILVEAPPSIRRGSGVSGSAELEAEDWPDFGDQPPP